jgi:hypothetical protein
VDTFDLFGHWRGGANQDAADEALRTGEPVKLGFLEKLYGGTVDDAQNIVNKKRQTALNEQYRGQAVAAGLTPHAGGGFADWGEGEGSLLARIRAGEEKVAKGKLEEAIGVKERLAKPAQDLALAQQAEATNSRKDQTAMGYATLDAQDKRIAAQSKENRLQRGFDRERGEARDMLSMQIAQMDSQLADKRMAYDRETRRMDRRDQMIAQLMSGLGQLGGAFSL